MAKRLEALLTRRGWNAKVGSVASAEEALVVLAREPVDAILTRLALPTLDGVALLGRVKSDFPSVVRLLVVDDSKGDTVRALPVAQQVVHTLQIAGGDDSIVEVLERCRLLRDTFASEAIHRVVGRLERLPSVPRTYWALTRAATRRDSSIADFAAVVESDPAMSLKVLQLVNSAFFRSATRVTSIHQAVSFLGIDLLKALALSAHVFRSFEKQALGTFSLEPFQQYSTRVARLAKQFLMRHPSADEAFSAGILHDIGKLVIAVRCPEEFASVSAQMMETFESAGTVERQLLGTSHAEVGGYLLGLWGLPFSTVEAVAYHESPSVLKAPKNVEVVAAVHAADTLLGILTCGEPEERLDVAFLERAGFANDLPLWRALAEEEAERVAA